MGAPDLLHRHLQVEAQTVAGGDVGEQQAFRFRRQLLDLRGKATGILGASQRAARALHAQDHQAAQPQTDQPAPRHRGRDPQRQIAPDQQRHRHRQRQQVQIQPRSGQKKDCHRQQDPQQEHDTLAVAHPALPPPAEPTSAPDAADPADAHADPRQQHQRQDRQIDLEGAIPLGIALVHIAEQTIAQFVAKEILDQFRTLQHQCHKPPAAEHQEDQHAAPVEHCQRLPPAAFERADDHDRQQRQQCRRSLGEKGQTESAPHQQAPAPRRCVRIATAQPGHHGRGLEQRQQGVGVDHVRAQRRDHATAPDQGRQPRSIGHKSTTQQQHQQAGQPECQRIGQARRPFVLPEQRHAARQRPIGHRRLGQVILVDVELRHQPVAAVQHLQRHRRVAALIRIKQRPRALEGQRHHQQEGGDQPVGARG